ncbi:PREDICTED: keratin-associated protein 13-1-like [Ceratotherium simum simum]|uniref:Keratin-associated protein n=1 Tax=Ceratotherium simum simum TaxID=73337 RepID=A0ABM1CRV9_CERSS|nr:PREDICTED: keratin-associated protein 13-1-like [Ceratotherium simum simum]
MSYSCCSGNFFSCSLGGYLHYPGSSCGSFYPSNLVYHTDLWSPSPCQRSCYRPRTSIRCISCWPTYAASLGSGSSSCCSLSYGSRSCYSLGCGSRGFRPLRYGVCGFPCLSYGSRFCRPIYFASRSCQSSCYRPACRSIFYQSTC